MRRTVDRASLTLFVLVTAVALGLAWLDGCAEALAAAEAAAARRERDLALQRERAALAERLAARAALERAEADLLEAALLRDPRLGTVEGLYDHAKSTGARLGVCTCNYAFKDRGR